MFGFISGVGLTLMIVWFWRNIEQHQETKSLEHAYAAYDPVHTEFFIKTYRDETDREIEISPEHHGSMKVIGKLRSHIWSMKGQRVRAQVVYWLIEQIRLMQQEAVGVKHRGTRGNEESLRESGY